jgi:hypothetical protein
MIRSRSYQSNRRVKTKLGHQSNCTRDARIMEILRRRRYALDAKREENEGSYVGSLGGKVPGPPLFIIFAPRVRAHLSPFLPDLRPRGFG